MKYSVVIGIFTLGICWTASSFSQKIVYEFPDAMPKHIQAAFLERCEKGKILYDINCSKCHTTAVKGKKIIPDFTPEQLKGYELRVSNAQHESSITETTITAEELGLIMNFLEYKKKK